MNVELYAGGVLAYDSRLPVESGYNVLSIAITDQVNKGGTATIILPPGHPLISGFPAFRVPVEIYRDGKLRWRGRPLPPSDDLFCRRTIVCEGELCFLQDVVHRPYLYQSDPSTIFAQVIDVYNSVVDPWKRFLVGTVTVTDPNDYIRLESQNPSSVLDVVQKLLDRCGGYIFFDSADDGTRRINWYASMPYSCNQTVRLGENLIDYNSQSTLTNFATRIVPYGAVMEDGHRLTLDIDGLDYVQDDDSISLRGVIEKPMIYNDITLPDNLESRAKKDLSTMSLIPNVIQLSAIDLSRQDKTLDAFTVGQRVPTDSAPHNLSGLFDLTALTEDLVDPSVGSITLSRETASLTGSDGRTLSGAVAVGDRKNGEAMQKAEQEIRADYQRNIAVIEQKLSSKITQTADEINMSVSENRESINDLSVNGRNMQEQITEIKQTSEDINMSVQKIIDNGVDKVSTEFGLTIDGSCVDIHRSGTEMRNSLDETGMYVKRSEDVMLQANANGVIATDVSVRNYLIIGSHARFEDYSDGTDSARTACFWI